MTDAKQKETPYLKSGPIDIVKYRPLYLAISALLLIPGIVFIVLMMVNSPSHTPVRLGIDFTGGTILDYGFQQDIGQKDLNVIRGIFDEYGYANPVIQIQEPRTEMLSSAAAPSESEGEQLGPAPGESVAAVEGETEGTVGDGSQSQPAGFEINTLVSIRSKQIGQGDQTGIENALREAFGSMTLLQKNSIGPTLASELLTNAVIALVAAYILIVGYLTFRFQFDYAICALIALAHDTLFVFGVFAALGYLFQVEVDSMFVTAILTVVGFSVHDTIVVFDRLRENSRVLYSKKLPFAQIANLSVNQTLARSINTSLTALFPLFALYFFGGETTREFVLALILGIVIGTYSSICVASLLLAWWREKEGRSVATSIANA